MRKHLCPGIICDIPVNVFVADHCSGYFDLGARFAEIGISGSWNNALSILLHESFEACAARCACRYVRANEREQHDSYSFYFSHEEFERISQEQAIFLEKVIPYLEKAWKRFHKATAQ